MGVTLHVARYRPNVKPKAARFVACPCYRLPLLNGTKPLTLKYPEQVSLPGPMPTPQQVRIFRATPTVISVPDYSKGFGHTDLVTCSVPPNMSVGPASPVTLEACRSGPSSAPRDRCSAS
ncbi:hypothetical protein EV128_117132 [Rhizobium azibense]|nr:hypothetical protein EV128_117132 [Rhizobium azibense]